MVIRNKKQTEGQPIILKLSCVHFRKIKVRLMKTLYLLSIILFISCGNSELKRENIKPGFINKPGKYNILNPNQKHRTVILKEFKDESLILAIMDSKNKILYQQNLNESFSKYHYWCLYVDNDINIWFYNSDYGSSKAIIFNNETGSYEIKDFCETRQSLPKDFKKELKTKNTLENCKSLKG